MEDKASSSKPSRRNTKQSYRLSRIRPFACLALIMVSGLIVLNLALALLSDAI